MSPGPEHLIVAPILIPLFAGALMLFYEDRQAKRIISLVATAMLPFVAFALLDRSEAPSGGTEVGLYLLGNWPSPFAIVLVLDRLSALMLLLTSVLALAALVFAAAGWDRQGQHFHSLFQFLLMGLNGAFLTGDLFNLFVFFEVLLAASYGLMLHGSGPLQGAGRPPLHRHQPRRLAAVPDRRQPDLRRHRHAQHGRPRGEGRRGARGGPAAAARRRRQPRHRLPGQGRHVAAVVLAADHLHGRRAAGGGGLRRAEQGRGLCGAAGLLARLRRRRHPFGGARGRAADRGRAGDRRPSACSGCWPRRGSGG